MLPQFGFWRIELPLGVFEFGSKLCCESIFYAFLMPKRKARKVAKKPAASNVNENENDTQCDADTNGRLAEVAFVEQQGIRFCFISLVLV
jgi:hypothetical protein